MLGTIWCPKSPIVAWCMKHQLIEQYSWNRSRRVRATAQSHHGNQTLLSEARSETIARNSRSETIARNSHPTRQFDLMLFFPILDFAYDQGRESLLGFRLRNTKMPCLVKVSNHDLCLAQYICQFCVALPIDRLPLRWWPWGRCVIWWWSFIILHDSLKQVPWAVLRDCGANILPPLGIAICIDYKLQKKNGEMLQFSLLYNLYCTETLQHNTILDLYVVYWIK